MRAINVAFGTDLGYLPHLGTALQSLYEHNRDEEVNTFILSPGLPPGEEERFQMLAASFDRRINFVDVNIEHYRHLHVHSHFSHAIYLRFALPDVVPVDKIIYLDCDILVEANLGPLWDVDVSEHGCAGMAETGVFGEGNLARIGLVDDIYINSGVLVLNLTFWRTHQVARRCMEWIASFPENAVCPDQDAINYVLHGLKVEIDEMWNWNPIASADPSDMERHPSRIIHFAGPVKPWMRWYDFAMCRRYAAYRGKTPWGPGYAAEEPRNIAQFLLVAAQLIDEKDFREAVIQFNNALRLKLAVQQTKTVLEFRLLSLAHSLATGSDMQSACEVYRMYFENLGFPYSYSAGLYAYPNLLD